MKKKTKNKKTINKICVVGIGIYVMCILINQQKSLNSYKKSEKYYENEIEAKIAYQNNLKQTKANLNSEEYIEKIAREKLDMYLPNEKVYINKNN